MEGGNYIKEGRDSAKSTCLIFSPKEEDEVGALGRYLQLFTVSIEKKNVQFNQNSIQNLISNMTSYNFDLYCKEKSLVKMMN